MQQLFLNRINKPLLQIIQCYLQGFQVLLHNLFSIFGHFQVGLLKRFSSDQEINSSLLKSKICFKYLFQILLLPYNQFPNLEINSFTMPPLFEQQNINRFIRKNFTFPKVLNISHIQNWAKLLLNQSLIQIYLLDNYFVKEIYEFITKSFYPGAKKLKQTKQFKDLIQIIWKQSYCFLKDIYREFQGNLKQQLEVQYANADITNNFQNLINSLFQYSPKVFRLYYSQLNEIQNISTSQSSLHKSDLALKDYIIASIFQECNGKKLIQIQQNIKKNNLFEQIEDYKFLTEKALSCFMSFKKDIYSKYKKKPSKNKQSTTLKNFQTQYLQRLEIQQLQPSKCVNCSQFFYQNTLVSKQLSSMIDIQTIESVKSIKQSATKIIQSICSFLCKGSGTLLFNCRPRLFGFQPIGQYLTLKQQQTAKVNFMNLMNSIYPERYKKFIHLEISFVPLIQNPRCFAGALMKQKSSKMFVERQYLSNLQVMRVKIASKKVGLLFGCNIDKKNYFYSRLKSMNIQLQGEDIYNQMKNQTFQHAKILDQKKLKQLLSQFGDDEVINFCKGRREPLPNFHQGYCLQIQTKSVPIRRI